MKYLNSLNLFLIVLLNIDYVYCYLLTNTIKGSLCMTECKLYDGYYSCYYKHIKSKYFNYFSIHRNLNLKNLISNNLS